MMKKSVLYALTFLAGSSSLLHAQWKALPQGEVTRIAFGSCAKHWQAQPIWNAIIAEKPDVFLFLGDAIYADTDGKRAWDVTEEQLRGEWARLADKPEFQLAQQSMPFLATWDNHDYGTHNGGAEYFLKDASKAAFLDFFGEPTESPRRSHSGVYHSVILGVEGKKLQIILLDTRFNKGPFVKGGLSKKEAKKQGVVGKYAPQSDIMASLLGGAQWEWLETELKKPADLRIVCSSTQVIPDQKGMDEWGNYPHERERLLRLLAPLKRNTLLLSGNVHFTEISEADGLTEFTSSGMTHIEPYYAECHNKYRVAGPSIELNYGLLRIDWSNSRVVMEARSHKNALLLEKSYTFTKS